MPSGMPSAMRSRSRSAVWMRRSMPGRSSRNFCRRGIIQNEAKAVEADSVTCMPPASALQRFRRLADMRQAERDIGEETLAGLGQAHLAVTALEQLDAELLLQAAHRVGDGGLRHAELARRRR